MQRANTKKIEIMSLIIAILQIFLLMNLIAANNYLIHQTNNLFEDSNITREKKNSKNLINSGLNLLSGILSIKQIGVVSAYSKYGNYCCPETKTGKHCQTHYIDADFYYEDYDYYSNNCKYNLTKGTCNSINCECCCPETKAGVMCKDVNLYYENCDRNLVQDYCPDDCIRCCPKTTEGIFCKDVSKFHHDVCAEDYNLAWASCQSVNCREVALNEPDIPPPQDNLDLDVIWNCCLETTNGAICQDIASITPELCAVAPLPTKCEQVADCKLGCCFDPIEGLCTTKSSKKKCESDGGEWNDDINCLTSECQKGCCVLGSNVQFVTETRCEMLSLREGFEKNFKGDLTTEIECLALAANQFKGACILQGACGIKTEAECLSNGGDFHKDYLCSHPNLETECERQTSVNCVEGKDEIYWFDSCGNQENIYSSDKDASWNNGKILTKEQSCNSDSANVNSEDCGNCNYFLGSVCSETRSGETHIKEGNFVCKSMNCVDEKGKERHNGESWCVYDSSIGEVDSPSRGMIASDAVGSRHWKRYCIDGEVKIEPCADYRGAVCAQSVIEEDGQTFSIASCVANEAFLCLGYNENQDTMEKNCNENKHCMIKNINVDSYFKFDICVGRYPRGFNLRDSSESSDLICSMANQRCTVIYVKDWKGRWHCKKNCNCETKTFTQQMNDLCISLGDCGSYVNYIGEGTDNIKVVNAPMISWKDYKKYSEPVDGQFVEPQDIDKFLSSVFGTSTDVSVEEYEALLGGISGAAGIGAFWYYGAYNILPSAVLAFEIGSVTVLAYMKIFMAAAIGAIAGSYLASYLGISGDAATVMTIAGAAAGAFMMLQYFEIVYNPYGWIIALAVIAWIAIIGWGDTKQVIVEFTCLPWQAGVGGDNCEKCNEDNLKPCTEYRCSSLGQACELLNENTENPICQSIAYEPNPPVISPEEVLTDGYEFFNEKTKRVEIRAIDGGCIPEFTPVLFTLKTDEFAQCKYEFERTSNYDNMNNYPVEQNSFDINHTFGFSMPSLDSLEVYNVTGDLQEMFGNINMYVRCQDYHGNFNIDEYAVNFCINSGPDITAAYITKYIPEDGSYLKYGTNETGLIIYLNEPAECKYDLTKGKNYDDMTSSMQCNTNLLNPDLYGWSCSTTLTNLNNNENKFYIKCKDKPWVQTPEDINKYGKRNVNTEDFIYTLYVTETELVIDSITPQGTLESGFEPISVELEVKTSGGVDSGVCACYYEWAGNWVQFLNTFSSSHTQPGLNLMGGNFNIPIKCEDEAKNVVQGNAVFNIEVDSEPPVAVRVFYEGGNLKLITNEEAKCYYDFNSCEFNLENASSMTSLFSTEHSAEWIVGKTYYIKCKDIWGNENPTCAIKAEPSD